MAERKMKRRDFLKSAATVSVGSVLGAGLASACQTAATPAAEVPAEGAATEAPADAPAEAPAVVQDKRPINVVGIFPLSGFIAADGEEMRNGTVMAIDEINEQLGGLAGHELKYIEVDDVDSVGDQVTTAFERAIDVEKADVIFSGYHLTSAPEFDICANAGVLYYNVNTQKAWTDRYASDPEKYWSIFQCDPNDEWYGGGFAQYLDHLVATDQFVPEQGKTAAILHGDDTYDSFIGNTFNDTAQELGWDIVLKDTFTVGQVADWGPMLSNVRDANPSVFFSVTYNPADNAAMIQQWAQNPINAMVYQQYGPSVPEYLELAGEAANGVIWATVLGFLPDEIGDDFTARYEAKFGQTPGWANAPGCYDTTWTWAKAVALANDPFDYKKVAKLTEEGIHRGVTGSITFEDHGGRCYPWQTPDSSLGQAHIIVQIQDGQHQVIFPEPYDRSVYQTPPWFA
jgi:branched-chain amino acid transport system substrate-binding protein